METDQQVIEKEFVSISVIDQEGQTHNIDAPTDMGMNLMEVIKAYELPMKGTCGGMALCASCHAYVESDHILKAREDAEDQALDMAIEVDEEKSRLCCQISITESLEGLVVRMAPDGE
ncbi:MAG: 2Fe-2S iron-sulfur cluster-binding protein [Bacteroidota bacterium]